MTRPDDEELLAFLEGRMAEQGRDELLDRLDVDGALASELRRAAVGLEALRSLEPGVATAPSSTASRPAGPARISPWWIPAAMAATLLLAVPVTLGWARGVGGAQTPSVLGQPAAPDASFVLVLHGRWPDSGQLEAAEAEERGRQYWEWTSRLATDGVLMAAGDLRWEPGERVHVPEVGVSAAPTPIQDPDFLVGMFALRVRSYEEALEIARDCPHLRFGGSVTVRRVGGGFVTVPGMDDWSPRGD